MLMSKKAGKIAQCALIALFLGLSPFSVHASEAQMAWQEQHKKLEDALRAGNQMAACQQVALADGSLAVWYGELSATSQAVDLQADSYRRVAFADALQAKYPTSTRAFLDSQIERAVTGIQGKVTMADAVGIAVDARQARIELQQAHQQLQSFYNRIWNSYCR
jgi:hypothetical protein